LLAFFSAVVGALFSFAVMGAISLITFNTQDNPFGMLLVNGHIFFAPTVSWTAGFIIGIALIAIGTAFFPARRASKISAANAMRHYE
jgi:ABC-type antimicrobial peptide transport system permease subunit